MLISVGSHIRLSDGQTGTVVAMTGRRLTVQPDDSGELMSVLLGDWITEVNGEHGSCDVAGTLALDLIPKAERERIELIAHHLNEIETGFWHREPRSDRPWEPRPEFDPDLPIAERERAKVAEFATDSHPALSGRSLGTVRKWRGDYHRKGLAGLADKRLQRKLATVRDADPGLVKVIGEQLDATINEPTRTGDHFYRRVVEAGKKAGVAVPSKSTVRVLVEQLSRGRDPFGSARARRSAASSSGGAVERNDAVYPGEYVQVDSTVIDVQVLLPDGSTGRPELTLAIDEYTRTPLSWRVLPYGALKGVDAAAMIADCTTPRTSRPRWQGSTAFHAVRPPRNTVTAEREVADVAEAPVVVADNIELPAEAGPADGIPLIKPHALVTDNGKAFLAAEVMEACRGVSIYRARYGTGSDKAVVERAFRRLNTELWQSLPGYVGPNIEMRGRQPRQRKADDALAAALFTCDELEAILSSFFHGPWMNTPVRGNRIPGHDGDVSPREKWNHFVAVYGHVRVPESRDSYFAALKTEWRTIQPEGIEYHGRKYNSDILDGFRRQNSGLAKGRRADAHPIKVHPGDVSVIYWLHPTRQEWTPIEWVYSKETPLPFAERSWQMARRNAIAKHHDASERDIRDELEQLVGRAAEGPDVDARTRRIKAENDAATEAARTKRPTPKPHDPEPNGTANRASRKRRREVKQLS